MISEWAFLLIGVATFINCCSVFWLLCQRDKLEEEINDIFGFLKRHSELINENIGNTIKAKR